MKKLAALFLALVMLLSVVPMATAEEPIVIRYGTHWTAGWNPNEIDPATGTYTMTDEADRQLRLKAEEAVLLKHNVKIEHVQYAQDVRSELVLSVLAGNPCCEIARMWNGSESTVLAQNVLQPLDDYAYIFEGADWMWPTAVYGHNYFLNSNVAFTQYFPLVVNLTMLEAVPALKEADGSTLYPMELLERGQWTWSNFKDYLGKIHAFYSNTPAPEGCVNANIVAYEVDYRQSGLSAMFSNGGGIYGDTGLIANSKESIEAVAFYRELMELGYAEDPDTYNGWEPLWCQPGYDWGRGGAVFADCHSWGVKGEGDHLTERGESYAIMPFPAADRLVSVVDGVVTYDPAYQQVVSVGDIDGILKGISPEMTKLALEVYRTYWEAYYVEKAKSAGAEITSMDEYKAAVAKDEANKFGVDINKLVVIDGVEHDVGAQVLNAWIFNSENCIPNNVAGNLGLTLTWEHTIAKGLMGVEAMPAYEVAIEARKSLFDDVLAETAAILGTDELNDNQAPSITVTGTAVLALGADAAAYDWPQHFSAEDGFDGVMDPALAAYDVSGVDVATAGSYKVKAAFTDKSENKGEAEVEVIVYDPANTVAPTLTVVEELPTIAMDADASAIDWTAYVAEAKDASGLDLKAKVVADVSILDTSMPDLYPVTLTVTDYAGNTTSVEIEVEVVVE
ncbi:MAG: hypothetical protein IJD99_07730 [Clostridia bacterium]|nr:hypothetical protein [Clostridia bacterium]